MTIKVMLVDDHLVVVRGLKFFLNTQADIEVVGEAEDGEKALKCYEELKPDVVLMDLMMPVMDGVEATKKLRERYPQAKVVVLTSYSDQDHVIPALQAGAVGYQLKDVDPDELVKTIQAASIGEKLLHPKATNLLLEQMNGNGGNKKPDVHFKLTKREKDVLYHITLGKSNKEIASDLYITEKTVKTHVSNLLSKLHVHDRTQAAIYAMKENLFTERSEN
ncbi:response regulator [Halobacillus karajensis]|uniref:Transcriptional regulatory protein LiaR n=1 Tax=Halobacillus karajensis TaxID=195088 RepID=A0A024P860_9BACI|nr:response regulator transcription factor [Halobacillus karajensis]CDQ20301.1 Transcriptional regulatory protein LiaR [Halobacillus karajensis]CDQ25038.1 Transcriptional regulatory protein LiaR [Halobacillus karajensis]CDQ28601.1 Transcriptional regulatory protein LiaR [Halobacillus karajensis]